MPWWRVVDLTLASLSICNKENNMSTKVLEFFRLVLLRRMGIAGVMFGTAPFVFPMGLGRTAGGLATSLLGVLHVGDGGK